MSDAVMVPREPTEAMLAAADCAGMTFAGSDLDSADMTRMIWSAMLAASTPVGGWEDISTAPKDGKSVLIWNLEGHEIAAWDTFTPDSSDQPGNDAGWAGTYARPGRTREAGFGGADHWIYEAQGQPTHWMPLPPPPSVSIDNGSRPQEAVPTEPVIDRWADLERLARAAAKRAPGLWGSDIEKSEGEYGVGDESYSGFMVPYMETEHGKRLFDAHYCDVAEIHVDYDEDGAHAWDEAAREIFNYLAAVQPSAVLELITAARPQPADGCSSNEGAGQ